MDEKKPLHNAKKETDKAAIIAFMKLFNVFAPVGALEKSVTENKNEKDTYKKAQDFHFLPKIGVQKYRQNEKRIVELEEELSRLQEISGNKIMGLNSEQAQIVADLR